MPLDGLQRRRPSFFWKVLGNAVPVALQEETTSGHITNWARLIAIAALVQTSSKDHKGRVLSIGGALLKAAFSEIWLAHLLDPLDREDFRETLAIIACETAKKGIAFSVDDVAVLLLLENPECEAALGRLRRDLKV